jgi:hypothetical protein
MAKFIGKDGLEIDFNPAAKLEIENRGRWIETTAYFFRSWGGNRRINDAPYTGTVYFLGTNEYAETINQMQTV